MELAFLFFYKIEIKMATIAKGSITLVNVNDAYSVLFTPDSCAIKADFDGTNPDLTNAYTDITVVRGEEKHTFKLTLASFSNTAITYQQTVIDAYTKRIRLTSIPSDVLSGALTFTITTDDEFVADVTFTYSVIRETSMLDWILDWESNKTVIGDSYLISPKIFVGKKVENAEGLKTLTGVYIGPDDANTAGIYGYKEGKDVFHINAKGAMLGGWNVLSDCITTSNENGTISLGADGNLFYRTNKNELVWSLFQDGSATFAKGNVMLNSDGSAVFTGSIKASSGNVGGWTIDENVLYNTNIALNSAKHIIGVGGSNTFNVNNIKGSVQQHGGVYMFYDNANSYGLQGYLPSKNVGDNLYMIQSSFSLGSINRIASWDFDADSLYMGAKVNMQKKYTASSGDITIGSQGMRGNSWYIDTDGSVSFLKGEVQFAESSGSMVGWNLNAKRLSNPNVAIVSDTANAGIFMSVANGTDFNSLASSSLTDYIDAHGGIYMKIKTDGVSFAAYDQNGHKIFKLRSNGVSSIANWNIENDALFVGSKKVDAGSFTDAAGSMTFSGTGIRGNKWRLEADGSGAIAGGNILWNKNGEVQFSNSVSLNWTNGIDKANSAASVAQKIAFGQMIFRDPEFMLGKWNDTHFYPWNFDSNVKIAVSTDNLLNVIKQYGLYAYGDGVLVRTINIISSDGSISSSYSPGVTLESGKKAQIMPAKDSVTNTDTIQIIFECNGNLLGIVTDMSVNNGITNYTTIKDLYDGSSVSNGNIPAKRQIISDTTAPNSTQKVMEISCNRWQSYNDWRVCGFYFANKSRANGEFIVKIVAKIPEGWMIENAHNQYGDNGKTTWITSTLGTGNYEEYVCIVKCGSTGTFSTINHFALKHNDTDKQKINTGGNSESNLTIWIDDATQQQTVQIKEVTWRVAYATVYDATSSDKVTTTIDSHGIYTGTLRADQIIAGTIKSSLINADELLSNGKAWALKQDGSGYLARGNVSWGTDGSLTINGSIKASSGKIGDFSINNEGLYYGDISKWTSTEKTNMSQIGPNFVRMEQQVGYFSAGDIAYQKIGLGAGSDPTQSKEYDTYCGSAFYIYRKMNSISDMYFPAAQIISDNVANRNIGLRIVGGLQVYGGIIESGYVMEYTKSGDAIVLDVSFGTTFLLFNRASESHDFFFPKLSQIREQLGISDKTKSFCVPVRVICGSGSANCCISAASAASNSPGKEEGGSIVDNNGNWDYKNNKSYGANRMALAAGDSWSFALVYTPSTGYYIQILNTQN